MNADYYQKTRCRMCDGGQLQHVLSLTPTPPGNNFLRREQLTEPEARYPLDLYHCSHCHHVQLGHVVDPSILYQDNYLYVSGTSSHFVRHLRQYATDIVSRFALAAGDLVVDIGSNDGTCLRFFQQIGMTVLGVDPATEIAARATADGIETVPTFFSESVARNLKATYGPASLVTSHNACAHIDELDDVVRGVAHWLGDDGVFVLEVGYFVDVYSQLFFDTIYHEHLDYHTVGPFEHLFARCGMELISVQRIEPQGGSIRVMAQKAGGRFRSDGSAPELVALERRLGLDQPATFVTFGQKINDVGTRLRQMIGAARLPGQSVAAYGAPTKSTTLLAHFGIGADSIDFIVDDNPMKQGRYTPMTHIPVTDTEELYRRRPDFALILAWNFAQPIMRMHQRFVEQGGQFMIPMPEPQIVKGLA